MRSMIFMKKIVNFLRFVWRLPRKLMVFLIVLYQKTLSPDHGLIRSLFPHGYCKFHPSCSDYAKESIMKHGVIWGGIKTVWRLLRCNPFGRGGNDFP